MPRTKTFSAEQSARIQKAVEHLVTNYPSQGDLARALGVSAQSVSSVLRGRGVGLPFAGPVARLMGVSIDDLLGPSPPAPVVYRSDWVFKGVEASFDSKRHTLRDAETVLELLRGAPEEVHMKERTYEEAAKAWLDTAAEYRSLNRKLTTMILLLESSGIEVLR